MTNRNSEDYPWPVNAGLPDPEALSWMPQIVESRKQQVCVADTLESIRAGALASKAHSRQANSGNCNKLEILCQMKLDGVTHAVMDPTYGPFAVDPNDWESWPLDVPPGQGAFSLESDQPGMIEPLVVERDADSPVFDWFLAEKWGVLRGFELAMEFVLRYWPASRRDEYWRNSYRRVAAVAQNLRGALLSRGRVPESVDDIEYTQQKERIGLLADFIYDDGDPRWDGLAEELERLCLAEERV